MDLFEENEKISIIQQNIFEKIIRSRQKKDEVIRRNLSNLSNLNYFASLQTVSNFAMCSLCSMHCILVCYRMLVHENN